MQNGFIEVTATHSPLAFMYALVQATVTLNGQTVRRGWGTHVLEVQPGQHFVAVSYPWIFGDMGVNSATVDVRAGEIVRIHYTARLLRFLPGKMRVEEPIPSARVVK